METEVQLASFKIIGIAIRTTNQNGQAASDLGQLWQQFYNEDILSQIPGKLNNDIYSVYTAYTSDYTGEYTALIGCRVTSLDSIPNGLTGKAFTGGKYALHQARGKMPDAVMNAWQHIWDREKELNRKYTADFEVYGPKSQNPENAAVDIYIAIK